MGERARVGTDGPRFVLIHSPFLGPAVWDALIGALARRGATASAPDLRAGLKAGAGAYEAMAALATAGMEPGAIVVAHSGAGGLIPSIRAAAGERLGGVGLGGAGQGGAIFLDALLPHPGRSWFDTLPEEAVERLRAVASDGAAPPWPAWVGPEALRRLLPSEADRAAVVEQAPRAPLAFLDAPAPASPDWRDGLAFGYLQLSETYQAEAREAGALGWPVERLALHHLAMITDADSLAARLIAMRRRQSAL